MNSLNTAKMLFLLLVLPLALVNSGYGAELTEISISPTAVPDGVPVGVQQQFTATGTYSDDSVQDLTTTVTWSSSDPATASVDGNGLATGQAAGTANITASDSGLTSNIVALEVLDPTLVSINVVPAVVRIDLDLGRSLPFKAQGVFDSNQSYDVTDSVTWDSSVPAVATIDQSGVATAASAGTTNISASAAGETSNIVALTTELKNYPADAMTIEPQNPVALPIGREQKFVAVLRADDEALQIVTDTALWTSSNEAVAVVDQGLVQGMSIGSATITAEDSINSLQATVDVVVNDATLKSILMFPPSPADLPVGHTQFFTTGTGIEIGGHQRTDPGGLFTDNLRRVLRGGRWSVSNDAVALIEQIESGLIARVTGLALGNVDVVYTDYDAGGTPTGIEASVPLTVVSDLLEKIILDPDTSQSKAVGNSVGFKAWGVYSDDSYREITDDVIWVSSDTAVGVFDIETKGKLTTLDVAVGSTTDASAQMVNKDGILIPSSLPPFTRVTVNDGTLTSLIMSGRDVVVGETVNFKVEGTFTSGEVDDFTERATWSVDKPEFASVSNAPGTKGQVTGVRVSPPPGVKITATDPETNLSTNRTFTVSQP